MEASQRPTRPERTDESPPPAGENRSSDPPASASEPSVPGAAYAPSQAAAHTHGDRDDLRGEAIGRYTLHERIAAGGMASIYLGSLAGAAAFSRVVAIKRMHPQFTTDSSFVCRFRDEAWLSARLLHPSIVQTFDVVERDGELLLVMEYVDGVTLRILCREASLVGRSLPVDITAGILVPVLHGLHAAHEATDDEGRPLGIVHRDFSPHNIIIGRDGHAKILDFGIAKARTQQHVTSAGHLTGKFAYLAPEQIFGGVPDRRTDLFAAGIVLWETLAGQRLFREADISEAAIIERVLNKAVPPPSQFNPEVSHELDGIVLRALQRKPSRRQATARELALELEAVQSLASPSTIGACLSELCGTHLERLSRVLASTRRHSVATARPLAEPTDVPTVVLMPVHVTTTASTECLAPPARASARALGWRRAARLAAPLAILGAAAWVVSYSLANSSTEEVVKSGTTAIGGAKRLGGVDAQHADIIAPAEMPVVSKPVVDEQSTLPAGPESPSETGAAARHPKSANHVSQSSAPDRGSTQRRKNTASVPHATTVSGSSSDCDPPTYVGSDGIWHFRQGCI